MFALQKFHICCVFPPLWVADQMFVDFLIFHLTLGCSGHNWQHHSTISELLIYVLVPTLPRSQSNIANTLYLKLWLKLTYKGIGTPLIWGGHLKKFV